MRSKSSKSGVAILLGKIGVKLMPVLMKMQSEIIAIGKSLIGIKGAGLAASVGIYSYLLTWQMGVSLVIFLGVHEYGHLWAMHRCGMKTKGMFFIPMFGAAAVMDEQLKSANDEAYIALMGPIFGLAFFVLPVGYLYQYTGNELFAAIAGFMAFINLVNLFPINPLDGGRVLKALAYSKWVAASFAVTFGVSLVTAVFGALSGFTLLSAMSVVGFFELSKEFGVFHYFEKLILTAARAFGAGFAYLLVWYLLSGHSTFFLSAGAVFVLALILVVVVHDAHVATERVDAPTYAYPVLIVVDVFIGVRNLAMLRAGHIQPIRGYEQMSNLTKTGYTALFIGLVVLHIVAIFWLGHSRGAEFVRELVR